MCLVASGGEFCPEAGSCTWGCTCHTTGQDNPFHLTGATAALGHNVQLVS